MLKMPLEMNTIRSLLTPARQTDEEIWWFSYRDCLTGGSKAHDKDRMVYSQLRREFIDQLRVPRVLAKHA